MIKIVYLGNRLQQRGLNPTTIDLLLPRFQEMGISCTVASTKSNPILRLFDMVRVLSRNSRDATLVLIDTYSTMAFYYAWITGFWSYLLKVPYVLYLHGGNLPKRLKGRWNRLVFDHASALISPSGFLKEIFDKAGYKVQIIPNFIDIHQYPFDKHPIDCPRLLYVRSFDKIYNPIMAVEVISYILKHYPQAVLCMVGPDKDGSMQLVKKRLVELGLVERVRLTGKLTKPEWIQLSREYNVFINTTNVDNMPVSIVEAMALGLAVVSTSVGGIPYLIQHGINGLLCKPGNPEEMANQILTLFGSSDLYSKITRQALSTAHSLDWPGVQKKWEEFFEYFQPPPNG